MRNPEIERAAAILLSFWETEDIEPHLDAAQDEHRTCDAGNTSDIVEMFLRSASTPPTDTPTGSKQEED